MITDKLKQFLMDANAAGYAGGDDKKWIKESDGSTSIYFVQGDWKFHDNFFGGEPYGGREVVFKNDKSHWMMVYYGWVAEKANMDTVYSVLREALKHMPAVAPFRGPQRFADQGYVYQNQWQGTVEQFSGEEIINLDGVMVYKANYLGGLVDQRRGT